MARPALDDRGHGLHEPVRGRLRRRSRSQAGDEVILFGPGDRGEPTAQEWADALGTLSYDIVTRFAGRIPRSYAEGANPPEPTAYRGGSAVRERVCGRMTMARWRRITGVAGVATGVIAAGAGVVLAAEKIAVGRQRLRPDPEADEPLGELRGRPLTVLAGDGVPLHAEIDGPDDAPVTIIFCHGYALNQDVWHYQRA